MLKIRKKETTEKGSKTVLERLEYNMLKWYGNLLRMRDNRWPKRKFIRSLEGRKTRRRPDIKWESEVTGVMKQNLTPEEAVSR